MIERIKLSSLTDSHFCTLSEKRAFRNSKFRTLLVEQWVSGKKERCINLIQVSSARALRELKLKYPDDLKGVATSMVERCLNHLWFGLGDIRHAAPSLILDYQKHGSAAKVTRWLQKNCQGDIVVLEGSNYVRLSFDDENDFVLARLNFA